MKKLITYILVLCMMVIWALPCFATSSVNVNAEVDAYLAQVDALISAARKAARSGDLATAQKIEAQLIAMGVEIAVAGSATEAMVLFGMLPEGGTTLSVEKPVDTPAIHWYKTETIGYYYPMGSANYDFVVLQAVSFDDSSDMMQYNMQAVEDDDQVNTGGALLAAAGIQLYTTLLDAIPITSLCMTLGDFLMQFRDYTSNYDIQYAYIDCVTVLLSNENTYRFTYIRPTSSNADYVLSSVGAKMNIEYLVAGFTELVHPDGKVDTFPTASATQSAVLQHNDYESVYASIAAYRQGRVVQTYPDDLTLRVPKGDGTVLEIAVPMPATPEGPGNLF